jgi:hypothetical protein
MSDSFSNAKAAYEQSVRRLLVGRQIVSVIYYESPHEEGFEYWSSLPHVGHSLEQGLDFGMADGETCLVTWDQAFSQYDIAVRAGTMENELTGFHRYDVSSVAPWASILGKAVQNIEIYWSWIEDSQTHERVHYPQDLALNFGDSTVYLCSRKYQDRSDLLFPMADEIAVVFDDAVARRYRIGPFELEQELPS